MPCSLSRMPEPGSKFCNWPPICMLMRSCLCVYCLARRSNYKKYVYFSWHVQKPPVDNYMYIYTDVCTYVPVCICICLCTYVYVCAHMYMHVCAFCAHVWACACVCVSVCIVCVHVCVCVGACVCVRTCVSVCVFGQLCFVFSI